MDIKKQQVKFNVDTYVFDFNEYCMKNEEYKSYNEKAMKYHDTIMKLDILLDFMEDCNNEEFYKRIKTYKEDLIIYRNSWRDKQNTKRKELKIEYCKLCYETLDW